MNFKIRNEWGEKHATLFTTCELKQNVKFNGKCDALVVCKVRLAYADATKKF